ncbi:MAG TPA: undecaprenyl/decaprenyl-phosphate alpha-N-acetylglucosaminyl 1-phosphate transferase [Clostridia bacterium]|nr:undecaprenyl/decaprenyl-phosphate alpha-N-acetylglucosaminyl 1-phosphate transferase [Clostridia bacterium]
MFPYLWTFIIAVVIAYLLTPLVIKLAYGVGALDKPDKRKVHQKPTPRLGGLAIYLAFLAAVFYALPMEEEIKGILVGSSLIVLLGVIDDLKQLSAKTKLLGQIAAAFVLVGYGVRIEWITNPINGIFYLNKLSIPVTVFWIVGVTNTVNLIDGLDGLAAGVSTIASVTLLMVAFRFGQASTIFLTAAVAGACIGFLPYNFNPAKIFMGDTGSMFLGFVLSAIAVTGTLKSATTIALGVPILALGLPIIDTTCAIIRRYRNGTPIYKADKGHLHHRLLDMGMSQKKAVLVMYGISSVLGLTAIILSNLNNFILETILLLVVVLAIFLGARHLGVIGDKSREGKHYSN